MKLNKRILAVLMAVVTALVFAVPVFAESTSQTDVLLIAPAPVSDTDTEATDTVITGSDVSESDVSRSDTVSSDTDVNKGPMIDPAVSGNLSDSFTLMGYGMLGIFVVMLIIMIVILILNLVTKPRRK